jgi:hypothetical protein
MRRFALLVLNSVLPGTGLALDGQVVPGLALLLPALACLSAILLSPWSADPDAWRLGLGATAAFLALSAGASTALWWRERRSRCDPALVQRLFREAAARYLRSEWAEAEVAARRLTRAAPEEPGAWRVLELVARGRGATRLATIAGSRAQRLDNRAR